MKCDLKVARKETDKYEDGIYGCERITISYFNKNNILIKFVLFSPKENEFQYYAYLKNGKQRHYTLKNKIPKKYKLEIIEKLI